MEDIEDDEIRLPEDTLAILRQFQDDQLRRVQLEQIGEVSISEDWQLSQFWYDEATTTALADEIAAVARRELANPDNKINPPFKVACVAAPTLMKGILEREEFKSGLLDVKLFEYDERFRVKYPEQFVHYDFRAPGRLPEELIGQFDMIIADPPFLSEECIVKVSMTTRLLGKKPIVKLLFCTGAIMEDLIGRLLSCRRIEFVPSHANKLQNDFAAFINYNTATLK